jgi:hypothetical protein
MSHFRTHLNATGQRKTKVLALLVALATMVFLGLMTTGSAQAAPPAPAVTQNVTGQTAAGDPVTGTLAITRFVTQNGGLVALGSFTGTVGSAGVVTNQAVALPVQVAQASCQILNLVLGPLDLNLLGLLVHLDTVHLNITAQQGPGNLLGNLLCAVAGLLDGPGGALNGLAALLNRILAILG